jgi:hypothetical protein
VSLIDLTLRKPPFGLIGLSGAGLGVQSGASPLAAGLLAFLVSIRMRISRI